MWVYDILTGWVNYELNTQTSATAAAASAGASATSASAALTSEQNADVSEAGALAAKVAAESARDAALIQAGVYVDEPTGRAAVADGVAFKVQGSGDVAAYEYRRVNAGTVSTLIATYPSKQSIDSKLDATYTDRVDYVWGVLDSAKRLGLGLRRSGELDVGSLLDVTTHIEDLETLAPVELSERSGYLWGVKDAQGRLALGIDKDGAQ
jgi:hypothetical protein